MNRPKYRNLEKRRAVMTLLTHPECHALSDREIAKRCGVSNRFVGDLRRDLALSVNRTQIQKFTDAPEAKAGQRFHHEELGNLSVYGTQIQKFENLVKAPPSERFVCRKGKTYKMKTSEIGKKKRTLDTCASAEEEQVPRPPQQT